MKAQIIISDFSKNYQNNLRQVMHFISNISMDYEVYVLTNKTLSYNSFIDKVNVVKFSEMDVEIILGFLEDILKESKNIIFDSSILSRELASRLSIRLNLPALIDVKEIIQNENNFVLKKNVYSSNLEAEFMSEYFCISLSKTIPLSDNDFINSENNYKYHINYPSRHKTISIEEIESDEEKELLIVIGNGVDSDKDIKKIFSIAKTIDADIGASRPVCMSGKVPLEKLVGVSGRIYSPKVCITIGVSGSLAFYPGIEKSRVIISINNDKDARIIKNSDYYIDCNYKEVIDFLEMV